MSSILISHVFRCGPVSKLKTYWHQLHPEKNSAAQQMHDLILYHCFTCTDPCSCFSTLPMSRPPRSSPASCLPLSVVGASNSKSSGCSTHLWLLRGTQRDKVTSAKGICRTQRLYLFTYCTYETADIGGLLHQRSLVIEMWFSGSSGKITMCMRMHKYTYSAWWSAITTYLAGTMVVHVFACISVSSVLYCKLFI